jgi:hypothetical protein
MICRRAALRRPLRWGNDVMSKLETPMTRRYWERVGGTLIEEFVAVPAGPATGRRALDAVIIADGDKRIARTR